MPASGYAPPRSPPEPERPPDAAELVAAAGCGDREAVFRQRAEEMDHDGTRAVVDIVRRLDAPLAARLDARREEERHRADRRLRADLAELATEIKRGRRLGYVDDAAGVNLAAQLDDLSRCLARDEFGSVRRELAIRS